MSRPDTVLGFSMRVHGVSGAPLQNWLQVLCLLSLEPGYNQPLSHLKSDCWVRSCVCFCTAPPYKIPFRNRFAKFVYSTTSVTYSFFHIISPLQRWVIYSYTSPLSSFLALASCWYRGLKEGKYYKYWCYFLFNVWQCQLIPFLQYVHVRFVMVNISILPNFSGVCQLPQCYIPIFKLAVL